MKMPAYVCKIQWHEIYYNNHSPLSIWIHISRYLHCVFLKSGWQNAVKSSTSVAIFFAFIPNQYNLFSQTI